MITWLMGAWFVYHIIAALHFYGSDAATPASFEMALHQELVVLDIGGLLGTGGPTFILNYGVIITFAILIALYAEMARIVRYGLDRNFSKSQFDLYGSILLLVVTSVEMFFAPLAWTSVFIILFFASIMDVLIHVRYLHYFVRPGRA
ncbi:MAG: hypothetical protein KTR19_11170 [Hyphomicrobiales bacterium]|nr:hypothetical protein [Hyphomicrobiales bacterium]